MTPIPPNNYLTFQSLAFQRNAKGGHNHRQFNALCGDNPPTPVDGFGKWAVIDRPLRQGIAVPQGFNPSKLKIEILFGIWDGRFNWSGWDTRPVAGQEVESNISDLQWMAGVKAIGGPSPVVYVDSYSISQGSLVRNDLFPRDYRGIGWIISDGIEWGTCIREPQFGSRVYQEASFNIMGYSPLGSNTNAPPQQTTLAGGFFITNSQSNTALAIAAADSSAAPQALLETLARQILDSDRNNPCRGSRVSLTRRGIHDDLPLGLSVWVPPHQI